MVRIVLELIRHEFQQFFLDLRHVLAGCEPGAVADPEDMGVDRDGRLSEGGVEDHVGGLAPHAGQGFQRFARLRHLSAMLFQQDTA